MADELRKTIDGLTLLLARIEDLSGGLDPGALARDLARSAARAREHAERLAAARVTT